MNKLEKPARPDPSLRFRPHLLVRNRHIQTIAAHFFPGREAGMRNSAREMILEVADGVRLQGFYSPQPGGNSKGMVLLLHGWLGRAQSTYIIILGECLYRRGYSVFRLNRRDHGDTEHLNPGIYRSDLLDEVFEAARAVGELEPNRPLHLVGASLGGNFALRLALRHVENPLPNLGQTVAFSPAVNPYQTALSLDTGFPPYLIYFRRKWRRTYRQKREAHPDIYGDMSAVMTPRTIIHMTEAFAPRYSPYANALGYFNSYTVTPEMLAEVQTPVHMLSSADDPAVPIENIYPFRDINPHLQLYIQSHGGHIGFFDIFPYRQWLCQATLEILEGEGKMR